MVAGLLDRVALGSIGDVKAEEWEALATKRIFFGHQSVGRNMMKGVREVLAQRPEIRLNLVHTNDPATVSGPALIDANIGQNHDPASKSEAFARVIEAGLGPNAIAMYKYCYIDVGEDTDVDRFFDDYVARMRELERLHPGLTLVHITLPLKTAPGGPKEFVKHLIGRASETSVNVKRNRFNDRLRAEYGGRAPIFDLALLQATRPDGSRSFTRKGSEKVDMLAAEWTYDNGHLNEAGRRYVAEQFLIMLARLSASPYAGAADSTGATLAPAQFQ